MVVLHVYSPEPDAADRQRPTWLALRELKRQLPEWRFVHRATPIGDPQAYERALRALWGAPDDLVLLEGDKLPTLAMLLAFETCPEDLCAQAYRIYPRTTRLAEPVWAHRRGPAGAWIADGEAWADWVGFGLLRIRAEAMYRNPPAWEPGIWNGLDARVSRYLHARGESWCIHWAACPHHHQ